MPKRAEGYRGYMGRRKPEGLGWKTLLALAILLLISVVAGLIMVQKYVVYTDRGVRVESPLSQKAQDKAAGSDASVSVEVEIAARSGRAPPSCAGFTE